jgi:exopolysaccharide production protein ExoZ
MRFKNKRSSNGNIQTSYIDAEGGKLLPQLPNAASGNQPNDLARKRKPVEILGIQYFRAIAALFVVGYHISKQMYHLYGQPTLDTLQSGVDIFFVISGFVMILSTDAGRNTSPYDFIAKRIARIAPLYWVTTIVLIAVLMLAPQVVTTTRMTPAYAMSSMAFIVYNTPGYQGYYSVLLAPGWTLALEMFFYVLFTIGLIAGRCGWSLIICVALPLAFLTLSGEVFHPVGIAQFYTNTIMLEFVFGMVLGNLFKANRVSISSRHAVILMTIAMALLLFLPLDRSVWRCLRFGLPAVLLIAASLFVQYRRWPLLLLIGDASYSLYLTHFFVLSALAQLWKNLHFSSAFAIFAFYPVGLILCCSCGVLCWHFIEVPLSRMARSLLVRRPKSGKMALIEGG